MSRGLGVSDEVFTCVCNTHVFRLQDWGEGEVWLGWYEKPHRSPLGSRLSKAWKALRGKECFDADVVLSPQDRARLCNALNPATLTATFGLSQSGTNVGTVEIVPS